MSCRNLVMRFSCGLLFLGMLYAVQRPFKQYPGIEYEEFNLPQDWQRPAEWAFARLMYPPGPNDGYRGRGGDWHFGMSLWTQDYPRADRHFSEAVRRLTRLDVRSVEQSVNLDDGDDVYNWPWLYAVQVGEWGLTEAQAKVMRDYLLRGGFFMADDFHGTYEWEMFERRTKTRSSTPFSIWMIASRFPARRICGKDARIATAAERVLTGAASTTTRAASWWPSPTIPIWVTPGSGPMIRITRRSFQVWRFGWA